MKLELSVNEAVLIYKLFEKVDPTSFFCLDLTERIRKATEAEVKEADIRNSGVRNLGSDPSKIKIVRDMPINGSQEKLEV